MPGRPSGSGHTGHLVERDAELAEIVAALDAARAGSGSVLLIEGPAGIGKTALVDAGRAHAAERGMRVLHARGTEFEGEYPFGIVRQCLGPVVRRDAERERLLQGAAQLAEPVLVGVPESIDVPPPGLLHGLYWLVANLADETPLALLVDDAHWADEPSLRFLAYLARRVDALRIAVVIGARRDDDPGGGGGPALAEIRAHVGRSRLEPAPLGAQGVARRLREISGDAVDDEFARACHAAAGGNPFLLEELAHTLLTDGVPFEAASAERVDTVAPSTVADAVARSLARLGPEPTSLARAAAVLGDGCALDLAAQLSGLPVADAAAAAGELVRTGVLADAPELRFRHPMLAGAVRATLSEPELAVAHAAAAELLRARGAGPERIALQLLHAAPRGDPQVVSELRQAAVHAQQRGAATTAVVLLERALAEPPPAPLRGDLLTELGRAEFATASMAAATEHLLEAHRCATDPRARVLAITLLSSSMPADRDRRLQIVEMAESALPEIEPLDAELALRLRALLALGGHVDAAPQLAGATAAEASFLGHLVFGRMRPGASAAEIADIAQRASRRLDALLEEGTTWLGFTGMTLGFVWTDQLTDAERVTDLAIANARRRGSITDFASAMTMRATVRRRAGRLRDAEADARVALEAVLDPAWAFMRGIAPLACTLVDQGRADDAASEFDAAVRGEEIADSPPMLPVLLARMWVRAARRDHAAAVADWEEALRRALRGPSAAWIEDCAVAAECYAAIGDDEDAATVAAQARQLAAAWGTPGARGQALHVQARVGCRDDAVDVLRRAVELLSQSPARLHEARARVSLGAALRRAGHRVDSRTPLREGYELARVCGAEGLAEHARSELRASGIRLQRETASGADALTPSERRIAELAAGGLSNPQIAQELFLTVKTIEMHLTRSYRKLDIRRRADLAQALPANE